MDEEVEQRGGVARRELVADIALAPQLDRDRHARERDRRAIRAALALEPLVELPPRPAQVFVELKRPRWFFASSAVSTPKQARQRFTLRPVRRSRSYRCSKRVEVAMQVEHDVGVESERRQRPAQARELGARLETVDVLAHRRPARARG